AVAVNPWYLGTREAILGFLSLDVANWARRLLRQGDNVLFPFLFTIRSTSSTFPGNRHAVRALHLGRRCSSPKQADGSHRQQHCQRRYRRIQTRLGGHAIALCRGHPAWRDITGRRDDKRYRRWRAISRNGYRLFPWTAAKDRKPG